MESEESLLKPCKSLPPPFKDLDALHNRVGPHPGSVSSTQAEMEQGVSSPAKGIVEVGSMTQEDGVIRQREKIADHQRGRGREVAANVRKGGPLNLLDLPLDILKDIFKMVPHTSDLCSLAASNSALHSVATPLIYSRFDIVWPENSNGSDSRGGVDALTYGLATLVMREDLFEHDMFSNSATCGASCQRYACAQCGAVNLLNPTPKTSVKNRKLRRGNYFSQFTKKFSLGNGPADSVEDYLVTKDGGKMLGTLVAVSIARMPNLSDNQESFVWDMSTGILRDIWIALSSLGDHQSPKLEKIWVRLHHNEEPLSEAELTQTNTTPQPAQAPPSQAPALAAAQTTPSQNFDFEGIPRLVFAKNPREEPNFSIMPPLRSLTVLDIDEIAYLDELSVLLERSQDKLRELRIGFAPVLYSSCCDREQPPLKYVIKGGPLPLLMSKIYLGPNLSGAEVRSETPKDILDEPISKSPDSKVPGVNMDAIDPALFAESTPHEGREMPGSKSEVETSPLEVLRDPVERSNTNRKATSDQRSSNYEGLQSTDTAESTALQNALKPIQRLKLETLEIEKVTLHVITLYNTIDWTVLTSLTLLNCGDTEKLWSCLQEKFPPRKTLVVSTAMQSTKKRGSQPRLRRMPSSESLSKTLQFPLRLKRIHTDHVSSSLISFLKHALAPDSLEWLFLQDTSMHGSSSVTLEAIYRGPLRRHRSSLTKLMVDSTSGSKHSRTRGMTAKKWMLTREVLTFLSSGKMSRLRELAMVIEYKDWHFFLQRLPRIPHLRSLYVPYIAEHPYGALLELEDFAMGAIDVVALRPEVELCYLGMKDKCFEILETKNSKDGAGSSSANAGGGATDDDDDAEVHHDHSDDDDDDDDDDDSDDEDAAPVTPATQTQGMDSDIDPITDDDEPDPVGGGNNIKLKLREILFYEDRISIFKARHGRL